jgi:hypothetical protein
MRMKRIIPWLGAALILVIIFGTIYGVVQQSQRSAANQPQIQIAEDTSAYLNKGFDPRLLAQGHVNMNTSLAPFVIIYDKTGRIVAGNGYLNGRIPKAPLGVLTSSIGQPYNAVTWQPQEDARVASVTVSANKYYVLSGRSLTEVEKNEDLTLQNSAIDGLLALVVLGGTYLLVESKTKK